MIIPAICLYVFIGIQLWVAKWVSMFLTGQIRTPLDHFQGILMLLFMIPFWPAFLMRGALK